VSREIQLTRGKVAVVDDEDYALVCGVPWVAAEKRGKFYAQRSVGPRGARKTVAMARLIMNAGPGLVVDHRDGNTLDNRRANLRLATNAQNVANQRRARPAASGFKGVRHRHHWKLKKPWCAEIDANGKHIHLGYFATAEEAAAAYDRAAVEHFGEFASTNAPAASAGRAVLG
jgi:hypothetical protein